MQNEKPLSIFLAKFQILVFFADIVVEILSENHNIICQNKQKGSFRVL